MVKENAIYKLDFICTKSCLSIGLFQEDCLSNLGDFNMILENNENEGEWEAVSLADSTWALR